MVNNIKVVVVDDSAFMRKVISSILEEDPSIKVVATAKNGLEAIDKVCELKPDVVTMDVEMPKMDGITAVREIMRKCPVPIVMVSSHTYEGAEATIKALEAGAVDFVPKPSGPISLDIRKVADEIKKKVKLAATVDVKRAGLTVSKVKATRPLTLGTVKVGAPRVVAIGTSTGGPRALQQVIPALPKDMPCGVLVVQHMPPGFTKSLANRLNQLSALTVEEASGGEEVKGGMVYIAPGDKHLIVESRGGKLYTKLLDTPPYGGHKPSVDVLMMSVADEACPKAVGVIMTGMGKDGAKGMKLIKEKGGKTIAEDASTCVVFGMPKAAIELNVVDVVVPVNKIAEEIVKMVKG